MNSSVPESVPGRSHYSQRYSRDGRVFSYAHQIDSVLSFEPQSVLEVGVGGGVVTAALRAMGIAVTTFDVQPELGPDILGSVTNIPCEDNSYDVALCCQVLEHLPFDQFGPALGELRRVVRSGLVLSLPDVTRHHFVAMKLPKLPKFQWSWSLPHIRPEKMPQSPFDRAGHYWEIGFAGYPSKRVLNSIMTAGWHVASTWRVPEMTWHRFFRLTK
jgi:hypothetical protein